MSKKWNSGTGTHGESSQKICKSAESGTTVPEALNGFILYMRDEKQASPYTLDSYERDLLRFTNGLDDEDSEPLLASVTAEEIRDHMRTLIDRGLSKATVRRAMYALSSFFGWALRWELIESNPTGRVTVPRRKRTREARALSKRERAIVIAAADRLGKESRRQLDHQAPLLVRMLLQTGFRRGELLRLYWRDVDLERREVFVRHGKGDKSRTVPLEDKDLIVRLTQLRDQRASSLPDYETSAVFVGTCGQPLPETTFYKIFRRVLAVAGLDSCGITPHSLRHTFGSVLCNRGVPVPHVMDLLGHADIGSTMIYVHSTPAALRAAVRKLRE